MSLLVAQGIRKTFREGGQTVEVLQSVDMQIVPGEIVALEGPSGSGKSTLLSILGCILTPTSGRLMVCGDAVDSSDERKLASFRKRCIGLVFQQYNLIPALTALENVALTLRIRGFRGRCARQLAKEGLRDVGLEDRMGFLPRDLSGGQKQRVAIARALAGEAPLVLADEPTANLDSETGAQILGLFRGIVDARGCGLLIVTHDAQVRRVCDRRLRIRDGRVLPAHDPGVVAEP